MSTSVGPDALIDRLGEVAGLTVLRDADITDEFHHDEALTASPHRPGAVALPTTTSQVAAVLRLASELGVAITTRGAGTGLAGGCIPPEGGLLLSTERMDRIVEVDTANQVAVVQAGVRLQQLDDVLAPLRLVYPVYPGENSASIGGNVATNAGGMRAVKYGVTRHHVLGLEAVLPSGEVIRTGGKFVKATTGYDLTQLLVGSEGTLAVVTEATKRGLRATAIPDITARARLTFKLVNGVPQAFEADSQTARLGKDGVTPMNLAEWLDTLVSDAPHLFESNAGGGAAGNASGGSGNRSGKNPFRKETWNLTEQMKLQKTDPQLAARLKASA